MYYLARWPVLAFAILCAASAAHSQDDDAALINDLPATKADKTAKDDAKRGATPRAQVPADTGAADAPPADILPRMPGKSPPPAADRTTLVDDTAERREGERIAATKTATGIPENLADALSLALRHSPGILVAEAKVRQAEAELSEVRQSVVEELTVAYQQWSVEKKSFALMKQKVRLNEYAIPLGVVKHEARILYLLGATGGSRLAGDGHARPSAATPRGMGGMMPGGGMMGEMMGPGMMGQGMGGMGMGGMGMGGMMGSGMGAGMEESGNRRKKTTATTATMQPPATLPPSLPAYFQNAPDGVRRFLEKRLDMDFESQPFGDVLEYLESVANSDVVFIPLSTAHVDDQEPSVTIRMKQVTGASALQGLADIYHYAFVFRDYGILVIEPRNVAQIQAFRNSGAPMIAPPMIAAPEGIPQ